MHGHCCSATVCGPVTVQLASCLYLQREMSQSLPFVAFGDRLAEAARHEGLTVVPVSKGRR